MDLLAFEGQDLYFDEHMPAEIDLLIKSASECYGTSEAEAQLIHAFFLAPDNLTVLVALYRYYYYQHRYKEALVVANHALKFSGRRIEFPENWENLSLDHLGVGVMKSMGMVRFYLIALKAAGYINLRLHNFELAQDMLRKVVALDSSDRLGASALLQIAIDYNSNEANELIRVKQA